MDDETRIRLSLGPVVSDAYERGEILEIRREQAGGNLMTRESVEKVITERGWNAITYGHDLLRIFRTSNISASRPMMIVLGDIGFHIGLPCLAKNRCRGDYSPTVLLELERYRHWDPLFNLPGSKPYSAKRSDVVWRGVSTGNPSLECQPGNRFALVERWFGREHEGINVAFSGICQGHNSWRRYVKDGMSISRMLDYKYIISAEGNDKDSGLQWKLASNSVVLMPAPRCESWLLERQLIPGFHYVKLEDDFSDLAVALEWCRQNEAMCEHISYNASAYVRQFMDLNREENLQREVVRRYLQTVEVVD